MDHHVTGCWVFVGFVAFVAFMLLLTGLFQGMVGVVRGSDAGDSHRRYWRTNHVDHLASPTLMLGCLYQSKLSTNQARRM